MRTMSRFRSATLITAILVGTAGVMTTTAPASPRQDSNAAPQTLRSDFFDIDFPGGTVDAFRKAVLAKKPNANIVLLPPAGEITLPPIQLRGVMLQSAFAVIVNAPTQRADGVQQRLSMNSPGTDGNGAPIIVLQGDLRTPMNAQPQPAGPTGESRIRSQPFSLSDIIGEDMLKKDDVLTAIEMSVATFGDDAAKTELRFHEPTNMLVARGPMEQLFTVEQTLNVLMESAQVVAHRNSITQSLADTDQLRLQLRAQKDDNAALRDQVERAAIVHEQLQRAMAERDEALHKLSMLTHELEITRIRLDDCQQKLAKP
ncbi:MAG: hypothetical protein KC983_04415 [Phycisphaerales bacterium]|nr:hypothetical protein [Phycisphaerales bacterium]